MISSSTCIGTISKSLQFPILFSPQVLLYLPLVCSNVTWNTTSFPPNPVPFPASPLQPTLSPFFWSQDLQKGVFKTPSSLLFPNASQWPSPIPMLFFTFSLGSLPSCVFLCLSFSSLGFAATLPPPPHAWYSRAHRALPHLLPFVHAFLSALNVLFISAVDSRIAILRIQLPRFL